VKKQWMAGAIVLSFLWCPLAFAQEAPQGDREGGWHQKMCTERYARKAARLAYLEAKLALTDQQRAAWNKWRQIKLDAAEQRRTTCLQHQHKEGANLTVIEREARLEKFLSNRLAQLQASKPALQALYDALSPEQKATFDRSQTHHHHWRHHGHGWHHHGWQHEGWHGEEHEGWQGEDHERM
jgi:periplasmic protein CpxP/Spy